MDRQTDIETEQSVQHNFDLNLRLFIFLVFLVFCTNFIFFPYDAKNAKVGN